MVVQRLDVVAAILRDAQGRLLLSQRPASKHQGGRWEFPGGKVEPGETLDQALARELDEELGVHVLSSSPFITIDHHYPEISVRLYFRDVESWSGLPTGREGQPFNWFDPGDIQHLQFPEANKPVVTALSLPDRWFILPDNFRDLKTDWIAGMRDQGVGGIYLRGARDEPANVVAGLVDRCRKEGLLTLVRDDVTLARSAGADGVHFSEAVARVQTSRPPIRLLSVASHDDEGLDKARALGADMAMLSPVNPTQTHPQAMALGWDKFEQLATGRALSVYALGGIQASDFSLARRKGARGIAAIRAFCPEA